VSYGIKEDQNMPRKKHTPEEIVAEMQQVHALAPRSAAVTERVQAANLGDDSPRNAHVKPRLTPDQVIISGATEERIG
jgi:hypothetical protein